MVGCDGNVAVGIFFAFSIIYDVVFGISSEAFEFGVFPLQILGI